MTDRLLIIEKNSRTAADINHYFHQHHWQVEVADSLKNAKALITESDFDPHVVFADFSLQPSLDIDGLEEVAENTGCCEWVLAVDDMKGVDHDLVDEMVYDVVEQPLDPKRLRAIMNRALRSSKTTRRLRQYEQHRESRYHFDALIGRSQPIVELKQMLRRLSEIPVSSLMICGETGTGKGLVARIIHHTGLRREGPLVELNCAALPRELLESELFGHETGAFTGARSRHRGLLEQADGGTLFLDELCDMDLDLQAKLLKAIEDKRLRRLGGEREISVDVQIIAATSADLNESIQQDRLRADLYHRLSVFCIDIPPLRRRKSDLAELVPRIIAELNTQSIRQVEVVPDEVWQALMGYDWPGNIRELRNVIERCVLLSTDEVFPVQWMQLPDVSGVGAPPVDGDSLRIPLDGSMALAEMDRYIIQTALERNNYNVAETARTLKTTRETLRYRIQKYHLDGTGPA